MIKTVGSGGNFSTLNGASGLFNYINVTGLTETLTAYIISDINELTTTTLKNPGFSVLIQPSGGTYTISGGTTIIDLSGTTNLTVDGINRNLVFAYTGSTPLIQLLNNSTGNTFKNLKIYGNGTTNGNIYLGTSATGTIGNSYNTFDNNYMTHIVYSRSALPTYHIYSNGSAGKINKYNIITNNEITNVATGAVYLINYTENTTIQNNHIYWTVTGNTTPVHGIYAANACANNTIDTNYIGGNGLYCGTGYYYNTATSLNFNGIYNYGTSASGNTIQNNLVKNISNWGTNTGITNQPQIAGINSRTQGLIKNNTITNFDIIMSANLWGLYTYYHNLEGNYIYNLTHTSTGAIYCNMYGIYTYQTVYNLRNRIYNLVGSATYASVYGIYILGSLANYYVMNNMVTNYHDGTRRTIYGISDINNSTTDNAYIIHNTVYISGVTNNTNACYGVQQNYNHPFYVYNNIININCNTTNNNKYVYRTAGVAGTNVTAITNAIITNTSYYAFCNTTNTTLATWQGAGKDVNSKNVFSSLLSFPTDGHLSSEAANSLIITGGTYLNYCINDYDYQLRTNPPDIGADQLRQISFYNCLANNWNF